MQSFENNDVYKPTDEEMEALKSASRNKKVERPDTVNSNASYEELHHVLDEHARALHALLERAPAAFPARAMLLQLLKGFDQLLNAGDQLDDTARLDRARESLFRVFDLGQAAASASGTPLERHADSPGA
jgi:hypothetical protein